MTRIILTCPRCKTTMVICGRPMTDIDPHRCHDTVRRTQLCEQCGRPKSSQEAAKLLAKKPKN